jgi:uncharacterized protein YndB with AHSA1/START domain
MKHPANRRNGAVAARPSALRVARRFSAAPEQVFNAWLEPEIARRWLFATASRPLAAVAIDARVGGSFRLAERGGGATVLTGEYVEILPYRRLVFTLAAGDRPRTVTRVTVEIRPVRTGCDLALTHEHVPPDRANRTEGRWTGVLYGLRETLASRPRRARQG